MINKLSYFEKQSLAKKTFLKTSQSSQENTCVGVSATSLKRDSGRRSKVPFSK